MSAGSEAVARTYQKKRQYVVTYKAEHGCQDCGERDPIVLEMDHRDPSTKNRKLRHFPNHKGRGWADLPWEDLIAELEKCDVVCANCHRRRTSIQQKWKVA